MRDGSQMDELGMVLSAFNHSTQETEALCELEANLGYIVTTCLKVKKNNKQTNPRKEGGGKGRRNERWIPRNNI